MMLELAVGDAYGAGFEFVDAEIVKAHNNLRGYRKHQKYDIGNGRYTDDTQMSIAIAEYFLEGKEWQPEKIADKFVEVFKRDVRQGYSRRMFEALSASSSGRELLSRLRRDSEQSGAAMRAAPVGHLPSVDEVIMISETQAKATHNS